MPKSELVRKFLQERTGFDAVIDNVQILTASNGNCTATMRVEKKHLNPMGSLHGSFSATIADLISSIALMVISPLTSVSIQLSLRYLSAAKLGDEILIDVKTLKAGKTLVFQNIEIRNKETNELLIIAEHTKFLVQNRTK